MEAEKQQTEMHYPGTQYLGPGTHIGTKIIKQIKPKSYIDGIAMQHDIDYLKSAGSRVGQIKADIRAFVKSYGSISLQALAMRAGLMGRLIGDILTNGSMFQFNQTLPGMTNNQTRQFGNYIEKIKNKYKITA